MVKIRRKGIAIVESYKGILLVSENGLKYSLPGGGVEKNESRRKAAIRELREETGLFTIYTKYLFSLEGKIWTNYKNKKIKNYSKIFKIRTIGLAKPKNEIKYIHWYNSNSNIKLSNSTKYILEKYKLLK
ncbi:MAG: NUDIX domain-containing protein [Nanoarchaeota archaeon]|nr:NUDIX domain-containing protein [Nanoarchaeota archaeon]